MYNYDTRQDYPSTAFIADILNERRIIPIFAIPPLKQSTYFNLRDTIRSAFIGNLADDEDDLLSEIERQYRVGCSETLPWTSVSGLTLPIDMSLWPDSSH